MIRFLIKKVFFDIWDNFVVVMIMNIGFVVPLLIFFLAGNYVENTGLSLLIIAAALLVFSLYSLGVNGIVHGYSKYQRNGFKAFKDAFRYHIGHAFFYFAFLIVVMFAIFYGIPFYMSFQNMVGYFLGMLTFWVLVSFLMAIQYFFPLCFHMEADGPFKTFKKCFIVLADNMGTSFFLLLRTIIDLALTILTATLIPGMTGISLSRMDTMRLLMKKYDFLEEHPEATKRDVNWEDLLYEERNLVGPRSLKNMIFPWKE